VLPPTQTSFAIVALPTGPTLYATLLTETGGVWGYTALTFIALPGDALTYPANHQTGVNLATFAWSPVPDSQGAILVIGTKKFGTDVDVSGLLPPGHNSFEVPPLPFAVTLYATLLTKTGGSYTRYQAITFTAAATTAPAQVTFVNTYSAAVHVNVDGHDLNLAAGQQVGPVAIVPARSGNDGVSVDVLANPACGASDAQTYFYAGRTFRFTVTTGPGICANGTAAPDFTVTPT
jgi:hypothetical protein